MGSVPNGHYAVLGVKTNASSEELKRAYRRCVIATHPDKGGTPEAFQAVRDAAEVLCDEDRRLEYDVRSRLAARMKQIETYYERSRGAAGTAGGRAGVHGRSRRSPAAEAEQEPDDPVWSDWRERAHSARVDQEERWRRAKERTAAFEKKWETAFKAFEAKREAQDAAKRRTANDRRQRRAHSARGARTTAKAPEWASGMGGGAWSREGRQSESKAGNKQRFPDENDRGDRATVFTAHGRFECYHISRSCKALMTACGTPVEHDLHFVTRVERRKPCRFCCRMESAAPPSERPATAPSGVGVGRPRSSRSVLAQKLPRRTYSPATSTPGSPSRSAPAHPRTTTASRADADGAPREAAGPPPGSTTALPRYVAPKGKLHHSTTSCPCLVGRSGVKELNAGDLHGLRACGAC